MPNNPQFNTYYHPEDVDPKLQLPVSHEPKKSRTRKWLKRLLLFFLVILIVFFAGASWEGWKFFEDSSKLFGGSTFSNAIKTFEPTTLKGEDRGNVNILLAGNSVDDPDHGGAALTDSIMIISLNTTANKIDLISIPRDLYVNIPGYGYNKINAAYPFGQTGNFNESPYPAGGMGLLEKTITNYLGVHVDYYMLVDYGALRNVVNTIGGVDVDIQSPDPRGLYDPNIDAADGGPLLLSNGVHLLNGQTALNLARARGDPAPDGRVSYGFPQSDFDRTEHQRQLIVAIEKKILTPGILFNPIKVGHIFDGLTGNIQTDLKINEARRVVEAFRNTKSQNIQSAGLTTDSDNYLQSYTTYDGQSALIPKAGIDNYTDIQNYLSSLTNSSN
jgi:LCP family protein required for cell wall assembly